MLSNSNKKIIRNTGMLFFRMIFAMAVALYTSRIVLDVLGVEDFGLYHVVAGFVLLLGFLHGAMTVATQRYFAFELGGATNAQLSGVFSTSLNIHVLLALFIVVVAETLGLWFVITQLNIENARLEAALYVYHLSVASFGISVVMVPFTAIIIAHERMGVFAVISMFDVTLKLLAVIALQFSSGDKLITYGILMLVVAFLTLSSYVLYYLSAFRCARYRLYWNAPQFREMMSYTAWNTWGNLAAAVSGQGTNILLNVFFGSTINAARTISFQANTALTSFTQSVQSAINPQIIKQYASGNLNQMHNLILLGARFNFFLLFLISLPVILEAKVLLSLWLVEVPLHSETFLRLIVIHSLIYSLSGTLMTAAQATGKIKLYQSVVGGILLFNLPFSYFLLSQGSVPEAVMIIAIFLEILSLGFRIMLIMPLIKMAAIDFFSNVLVRVISVTIISVPIPVFLQASRSESFVGVVVFMICTTLWVLLSIWMVGLSKNEKQYAVNFACNIWKKYRPH